ncbi:MAG: 5-oxoprolinase subunit PxpA [Candidatus Gastranaerophilales bacterium]|nr:5-oxoprolinase subunit PxpA [Candidatus Gastranaerophilales bacterium]
MIPLSNMRKEQNQQKQIFIDLNCDIGQSYGVYKNDLEYSILPYVSSVNISCGSHAGDPVTIMKALRIAKEYNLAVGAHIGYPDIQGFGYRSMNLNDEELQAVVLYQIGALNALAKAYNITIEHVRPHGALYKQAANSLDVSVSIAKAIAKIDPWLIFIGAAGETLEKAGELANIRVAPEVHLDRKYNFNGTFDFDAEGIVNPEYSLGQLELLVKESSVKNNQGGKTKINFRTIHLNVKSEFSVQIAKKAKELISQPVPVPITMVSNTGWV